jgi:protein involved in polysaccharide export with SLBB domain
MGEEIFRFPTATINVGVGTRFVTVGGQVRQPNRLSWSSDLTLLTAISAVGGGNDFARDGVELIRNHKMTVFSIKRLRKDPSQDPQLFPGDRIEQR